MVARLCGFILTKQKEVHSVVVRKIYRRGESFWNPGSSVCKDDKENFRQSRRGSDQQGKAGRNVRSVKGTNYNQLEARTLFPDHHGVKKC